MKPQPNRRIRVDERNLQAAHRARLTIWREAEAAPTRPGYCRRCKVARLSRDDREGLCWICQEEQ